MRLVCTVAAVFIHVYKSYLSVPYFEGSLSEDGNALKGICNKSFLTGEFSPKI